MNKVFCIAEIGLNHQGNLDLAKEMISLAKECNADMAKFQFYRPDEVLGISHPAIAEARRCQFTKDQHRELKQYCDTVGIEWGLSIFHPDLVDFTESLGIKRYKIASRAVANKQLLEEINNTKKPVIMSTGLSNTAEICSACEILKDCKIALMYCICQYPVELRFIDLSAMSRLSSFVRNVGLSSHCPLISPTLAAVGKGAVITENHVVKDKNQVGCDVSSSITFSEFMQMVGYIREMEKMG